MPTPLLWVEAALQVPPVWWGQMSLRKADSGDNQPYKRLVAFSQPREGTGEGLCIGTRWHIHATVPMRGQGTRSQAGLVAGMEPVMGACSLGRDLGTS